ncbi:MAG: PqqD family protein [Candidatus Omnitrophica bacterium]|nr:PqqD family protein [Candidatus Omnitrophota bacterium]
MIALESCIVKNEKVPWRVIEGDAILVDVGKGEVVHLNEVGAQIWDFLDSTKKVSTIIQHVCKVFEVDQKTAEEDTLQFIQLLLTKGLVVLSHE